MTYDHLTDSELIREAGVHRDVQVHHHGRTGNTGNGGWFGFSDVVHFF